MEDLEIISFATEAGWSHDWMMVRLQPRGKARGRRPAAPARAAARPNDGTSTGVIAEGHSATVGDANVTAFPDDDGDSAVADGHRGAVADAVSAGGQLPMCLESRLRNRA